MSDNSLTQLPLFDNSSNDLTQSEVRETTNKDGVRCVAIGQSGYISIIDAYRVYGHSTNPKRDWAVDKAKLDEQGNSTEFVLFQFTKNGRRTKGTPIVDAEQFARIAQVAKFKAWEPARQEMARLFVESQRKASIPVKQSKKFRAYLDAGYDPDEAKRAVAMREQQKQTYHAMTDEWKHRGAIRWQDFARLNNTITEAATGKSASAWKRELNVKESPRERFSFLKNGLIEMTQWLAVIIHKERDSQGIGQLEQDILDAGAVIDKDKLRRLMSDRDILQLPEPKQTNYLEDGA